MCGKGRDAHSEVRERSGDPPGGPGRVGILTRRLEKGQETHQVVREGSGDPPGDQVRVVRPTR